MTLKKLFMLGGVLAGAAYLQNKSRRDRVIGKARGVIDQARTRASDLAHKAESKAQDVIGATSRDNGVGYGGIGRTGNY